MMEMAGVSVRTALPGMPRSWRAQRTLVRCAEERGDVTTWAQAHRLGNLAAAKAHRALGVDPSAPPIDVSEAIGRADVLLLWRPMPRIFGLYVHEEESRPGILVNSSLPHGARRHTAAHELGHHYLGHDSTIDDGSSVVATHDDELGRAVTAQQPRGLWPAQEKAAEAFAAWFLMPRRATVVALDQMGMERPQAAVDAYRLSLILGTSYRSMVRHLPNLQLATQARARAWIKVPPSRLKAELDVAGRVRTSRSSEVWSIDYHFAEASVPLYSGDRVVVHPRPGQRVVAPPWLSPVADTDGAHGLARTYECTATGAGNSGSISVEGSAIGEGHGSTDWQVVVTAMAPPAGLQQP
jgi:Zn-dependent peptidase ImmA (M78 family)